MLSILKNFYRYTNENKLAALMAIIVTVTLIPLCFLPKSNGFVNDLLCFEIAGAAFLMFYVTRKIYRLASVN